MLGCLNSLRRKIQLFFYDSKKHVHVQHHNKMSEGNQDQLSWEQKHLSSANSLLTLSFTNIFPTLQLALVFQVVLKIYQGKQQIDMYSELIVLPR